MSDAPFNPRDGIDLVELYAAANALEADRIVRILEDEGIEALYRETTNTSFPSSAGAAYLVTVPEDRLAHARALIEQARTDGVLSLDGAFL